MSDDPPQNPLRTMKSPDFGGKLNEQLQALSNPDEQADLIISLLDIENEGAFKQLMMVAAQLRRQPAARSADAIFIAAQAKSGEALAQALNTLSLIGLPDQQERLFQLTSSAYIQGHLNAKSVVWLIGKIAVPDVYNRMMKIVADAGEPFASEYPAAFNAHTNTMQRRGY